MGDTDDLIAADMYCGGIISGISDGASEDEGVKDFQRFLEMLETHFHGRRCYVGKYGPLFSVSGDKNSSSKGKRSGCGLGTSGYGQGKVGIMVVTIDPPFRLVLGAFVAEGKEGAEGSEKWSYWEEEIGAQELAAHRQDLGWEGHTLENLRDCFVAATKGTQRRQSHPAAVARNNASSPPLCGNSPNAASAIDGTHARGASPQEGQQDPIEPAPSTLNKALVDDPHQRSPELSDGGAAPGEGTTLDLHYADPDIVGSWGVRLVQGGLSEGLVSSMLKCIKAAASSPLSSGENVYESDSSNRKNAETSLSRGKRRGGAQGFPKHPRRRGPATGARLAGTIPASTS